MAVARLPAALGASFQDIQSALNGFPPEEIQNEWEAILSHMVLACPTVTTTDEARRRVRDNLPFLLSNATDGWRANSWVSTTNEPDVQRLAQLFGDDTVTVAVQDQHERRNMTVREYARWWADRTQPARTKNGDEPWLYLKDWNFTASHAGWYTPPECFADDWLNEHWVMNACADGSAPDDGGVAGDHRFVYLGPEGSSTPLHADIFFSHSWSVNLCGRKRWTLVPVEARGIVARENGVAYRDGLQRLRHYVATHGTHELEPIEIVQEAGEAIFVPSGVYHTVVNEADTLSINHNWFTASNSRWPVRRLAQGLHAIRRPLSDFDRNDEIHVMSLLKRRTGMDIAELCNLFVFIAERRLRGDRKRGPPAATGSHPAVGEAADSLLCSDALHASRSCLELLMLVQVFSSDDIEEDRWAMYAQIEAGVAAVLNDAASQCPRFLTTWSAIWEAASGAVIPARHAECLRASVDEREHRLRVDRLLARLERAAATALYDWSAAVRFTIGLQSDHAVVDAKSLACRSGVAARG